MNEQTNDSLRQAEQTRQNNEKRILEILQESPSVFDIIKDRAIKQSEFLIDMYKVTNFRNDINIIIKFQVQAINHAKSKITEIFKVFDGVQFENVQLNSITIEKLLVGYLNIDTSSHNDICRRLSDKEGLLHS